MGHSMIQYKYVHCLKGKFWAQNRAVKGPLLVSLIPITNKQRSSRENSHELCLIARAVNMGIFNVK